MKLKVKHIVIAALVSTCLPLASRIGQAQDLQVPITARISLEKKVVTQHEPVIVDITFNNPSQHSVAINLGYEDEKIDIKVVGPGGAAVQKPKPLVKSGWASGDVFYVAPAAASVGSVALGEWFSFDKTGAYRIDLTLSPTPSPQEPFSYAILDNSATMDLTILPRDEPSLNSACADLLARTQDLSSSAAAITAAKALSTINDPAVVPFLAAAIKGNEFKGLMINALARLKTDKAVDALAAASRSTDPETRTLAHSALVGLGLAKN